MSVDDTGCGERSVRDEANSLRREYKARRRMAKQNREPFFPLPTAFLTVLNDHVLAPAATTLLLYLMLRANDAGEVKESMASIARVFGVTVSAMSRRFKVLEEAGFVKVLRLKEGGSYRAFLRPFPPTPAGEETEGSGQ